MRYRQLGSTGLEISEITFGCGPTAGLMVRGHAPDRLRAVARALDLGVTCFDTAPVYGDGQSELHLGEALRETGARPVIGSKVALEIDQLDDIVGGVRRSVENSLRRLNVDRIDVLYMHNRVGSHRAPRPDIGSGALVTVEDVLGSGGVAEGFERLRAEGKVGALGCCAYGGEMAALRDVMASRRFDAVLVQYSVLNPTAVKTPPGYAGPSFEGIMGSAAELGMGVTVIRALEAGVLTQAPQHPLASRRMDGRAPAYDAAVVRRIADAVGLSPAQVALRFALSRPEVSTVVVGFSADEHLVEAAAASDLGPLDAQALTVLDGILQQVS